MFSNTRSVLSTPLLATAVLIGVLSGLFGLVGEVVKFNHVAGWDFLLQIAFFGGILSLMMGLTWALRVFWQYVRGPN